MTVELNSLAELEPALRAIYPNGDLDLALAIRTFAVAGGIVWDSNPRAEVEESRVKARPLLGAIGARLSAQAA